jgi:iron complex transport system substrate-binding protein
MFNFGQKKMRINSTLLLFVLEIGMFMACTSQVKHADNTTNSTAETVSIRYAKGFNITTTDSSSTLKVFNPWQGATNEVYTYELSKSSAKKTLAKVETLNLPFDRVVCLSTTHVAFINSLKELNRIVGVSGSNYISNQYVKRQIEAGKVFDLGYEQSINFELLLQCKPEVVFAYGIGSESLGYLKRIRELGINVIMIGDYLEESPLGKAEWIKVFGLLLGRTREADSIFNFIEGEYLALKEQLQSQTRKPKVFINLPWNDVWYFPGNDNYMAKLIEDAGGDYVMRDLSGNQSHPISFEVAIEKGSESEFWINLGSFNSLSQIVQKYPRLKIMPPMLAGKVYNNNNHSTADGGNDMWESGVVNPHVIVKDLGKIFHPKALEHELHYYKKLE